jgi:SNF2 family DNA or RNA helicase
MTSVYDLLYVPQREDVDKAAGSRRFLDASDMGSGKTLKGVAFDERYNPNQRTLVVCPMAVIQHWRQWFIKLGVPVVALSHTGSGPPGPEYQAAMDRFVNRDNKVLVVHWQTLQKRLLLPRLKKVKWGLIIGDEIHNIQGRKSQQSIGLKSLKTNLKLGLSGTPATTNIENMWSPLNWLHPVTANGGFGSYWTFYNEYVESEEDFRGYRHTLGPKNLDEFLKRIEPWYVRHMKREQCCPNHPNGIMPWLKDKTYEVIKVDLPPQIRRVYEEMKKEMVAWVGEHQDEPVIAANFLARMIRLNQFTGAYASITPQGDVKLSEPSPKIDALMDVLSRTDRPIVVYSAYRQMIELMIARLKKVGIPCGMYTGGNKSTREDDKRRFQQRQIRVLGITIRAGGVGLDGLQDVSDTAVYLDRDWSPAFNVQSEDRLWRDGQSNAVTIIDLVSVNTIELGRRQGIQEKWSWLKSMLGDTQRIQEEALQDGS